MKVFIKDEVQLCASLLSQSNTPLNALSAWSVLEERHPDLVGMVCLDDYENNSVPLSISKYTKQPFDYLVPYFSTDKIYFLEDELLGNIKFNKGYKFYIDYTLMFDTNIASYINKLIRGEDLKNNQVKIVSFVNELLHDNLNFDTWFYMIENVKNIKEKIEFKEKSKLSFWKGLNKKFRQNMVSIQLFNSIDCNDYKKSLNPKPKYNFIQATRIAVDYCYDFYMSESGRENSLNFVLVQKLILLQIIGMVNIQLSSNNGYKKKMREYFKYIHDVVGIYFDRESVIALKYFIDRKNVTILNDFQKKMPIDNLLVKLENIAWDMAVPRVMEKLMVTLHDSKEGRYFIPMFVSFDSKLRELLSLYPLKGAVYCKKNTGILQLPKINTIEFFTKNGLIDEFNYFYSKPLKNERMSRPSPTLSNVEFLIKKEIEKTKKIIKGN